MFNLFKQLKRRQDLKIEHVGNYLIELGLREREEFPFRNVRLTKFKLSKLVYYVEGMSYVRLGRGMTDTEMHRTIYSMSVGELEDQWIEAGNTDLLDRLDYQFRSREWDGRLETSLLSSDEKDVIREVWEGFRGVSQWELSKSISEQLPYLRTFSREDVGEVYPVLFDRGDIEEFFLGMGLTDDPLWEQFGLTRDEL